MAQALRNLVNKSRQRIAAVYSAGVKKILKSSTKKKAQQQSSNQDEDSQNTEGVVESVQEKIRRNESLSQSEMARVIQ